MTFFDQNNIFIFKIQVNNIIFNKNICFNFSTLEHTLTIVMYDKIVQINIAIFSYRYLSSLDICKNEKGKIIKLFLNKM